MCGEGECGEGEREERMCGERGEGENEHRDSDCGDNERRCVESECAGIVSEERKHGEGEREEIRLRALIIPGQLGPMSRVLSCRTRRCLTRTISCCGMPSVMTTTSCSSESMASKMASAAKEGGTNTIEASAPVASLACKDISMAIE